MPDLATRLAYDLTRTSIATTSTVQAASFAVLRLMSEPADGVIAVVAGRGSTDDGYAGSFAWDAASVASDDNVDVLAITGVTTGRWVRLDGPTGGLADLSVTTAKLAASAVTTAKILDANVTTAKVAALAITPEKLSAPDDPLRIMLCGDSMMLGAGSSDADADRCTGPREYFWTTIRRWRGNVRLLGNVSSGRYTGGNAWLGDIRCVAVGGKRIDEIDALITTARTTSGAVDCYILMGGFNDIATAVGAGSTAAQASALALSRVTTSIANRLAADASVWVFVCTLPPTYTPTANYATISAASVLYNAGLAAIVAAAGPRVLVCPAFGGLGAAHIGADGTHPNGAGNTIAGRVMAEQVRRWMPGVAGQPFPRSIIRRAARPTLRFATMTTDKVTIPQNAAVSPTGAATFSFGMRLMPLESASSRVILTTGSAWNNGVTVLQEAGGFTVIVEKSGSSVSYLVQVAGNVTQPNRATILVCSFDATLHTFTVYCAREDAYGSVNGITTTTFDTTAVWDLTAAPLVLGKIVTFNGYLGPIADFWIAIGSTVTVDDVEAFAADGAIPTSATGHYPLNEGTGTSCAAGLGYGLTAATVTGSAWDAAGVTTWPWDLKAEEQARPQIIKSSLAPGTVTNAAVWESGDIVVPGAAIGDVVLVAPPAAPTADITWSGYVASAGNVRVRIATPLASVAVTTATWGVAVMH